MVRRLITEISNTFVLLISEEAASPKHAVAAHIIIIIIIIGCIFWTVLSLEQAIKAETGS
jgi:hypothetical protein